MITGASVNDQPRLARGGNREELLELTHLVHRELLRRSETLPPSWVEESAEDLSAGRLAGWYYPIASHGGGLGFYSLRADRAYGHIHVAEGRTAASRIRRLLRTMLDSLPPSIRSFDTGLTGLGPPEEAGLVRDLRSEPGGTILERLGMLRDLTPADASTSPEPPAGLRYVGVRSVTLDALTLLDWSAFQGTTDESLIGGKIEDNRRVLEGILSNRLGRFLEEASTILIDGSHRPVAALLTAEQSARQAIYLDLIVDPTQRRRGLAAALSRWGFRALWALGYTSVRLWVTEENLPARRLYEMLGFRPAVRAIIYRWSRAASGREDSPQPQRSM